ncbi:hypothetical protein B0H19DRAFT_367512 [Mycena capillaripes]|nr:hypothetical protein B0H19DRAFT_367512 [Mycena capillaripes]
MRSVFWPDDERTSGFCYGWTEPVLCVAGVVQQISEAENMLASLNGQSGWSRLAVSCGKTPVILGRCSFDQGNHRQYPSLKLKLLTGVDSEDYNIIYYRRNI